VAQDDVFLNPSRSGADGIPYVVVIQSDLLDGLATRLTMPLAEPEAMGKVPPVLCPTISVNGRRLQALAHYTAPLPAKLLRLHVGEALQKSLLVMANEVKQSKNI